MNNWNEDKALVEFKLSTADGKIEKIFSALHELRELITAHNQIEQSEFSKIWQEIAVLKVKAGVWGIIGGAIPVAIALLVHYTKGS